MNQVKVETSGMDEKYEESSKQIAELIQAMDFDSQDKKAKFVVKELEKRHGQDWACIADPISTFIQCFGVSKRPDQYIRLTNGVDRLRIWRLTDAEYQKQEINRLKSKIEELQQKYTIETSQLISDHKKAETDIQIDKQSMQKEIEKLREKKEKLKQNQSVQTKKIISLESELQLSSQQTIQYQSQTRHLEQELHEMRMKMAQMTEMIDPNTQLVKGMSAIITSLQEDLEMKRTSDQDVARMLLQSKQQELVRCDQIEKVLSEKVNQLEQKIQELSNSINFKIDDHEDQIQLLNQAYVTTHSQYQQCAESIQQTSRTLVEKIDTMKEQQSMNLDLAAEIEQSKVQKTQSDLKTKIKQIFDHLETLDSQHSQVQKSLNTFKNSFENELQPQVSECQRQLGSFQSKLTLHDSLINKCLDQFEQSLLDTKMASTNEGTWKQKHMQQSPPLGLKTDFSGFHKIDEALGPIRNAMQKLREKNDQTQDVLEQVLQKSRRQTNSKSAKSITKRRERGTSLPYLHL